jgi:O-antigen ligase
MTLFTPFRAPSWHSWLPLLAVIALPFGRSVELFVLIMAMIGIYDLIKDHSHIRSSKGLKLFSLFFLFFWIPALLSLPDAVNLNHSATNVFGMLRFYFAGLFIINRITDYKSHLWLATGIGLVMVFWSLDGWVQLIYGQDVFGLPGDGVHISGIFGRNLKLGLMIIPFFAVAIVALRQKIGTYLSLVMVLLLISAILLSGSRASWVSLLTMGLLWLTLFRPQNIVISRKNMITSLVGVLLMGIAVLNSPQFQSRVNASAVAFNGGYTAINDASSGRLPLWTGALRMFEANPINGVGARGFRYAYPDYANKDDIWVDFSLPREQQMGQLHAHQIVLEFMTDTGCIGLIGYFIALGILFIKWRPIAISQSNQIGTAYLISLMAVLFPINSHLSFFSSDWAQVIWFLVALCVSAMVSKQNDA